MSIAINENILFFKRWIKSPLQLGTFAPISNSLAKKATISIMNYVNKNSNILEVGAGTGKLTRELLKSGVDEKNIKTIELDVDFHKFLEKNIPNVHHINGNAFDVDKLIKKDWLENVDVIVSVIPLMYMSESDRNKLTKKLFQSVGKNIPIIHVTYNPSSPLKNNKDIKSSRLHSVWFNFPPGFVWMYEETNKIG